MDGRDEEAEEREIGTNERRRNDEERRRLSMSGMVELTSERTVSLSSLLNELLLFLSFSSTTMRHPRRPTTNN